MRILIWVLLAPGLVWAALRVGGWDHGVLVQLMPFTTYVAAWAWIPVLVAFGFRRWRAGVVALLVAGVLTALVLPRVIPNGGAEGEVALHVMTANLRLGGADAATVVRLVRENDVAPLAVQEFTPTEKAAFTAAGLDALLPYGSFADEPGASGSGIYSRFPVSAAGDERNGGGFRQAYGTIQPPGAAAVLVESVHPAAPYATGGKVESDWRKDLAAEPHADPHGVPRILLGDFNSTFDNAEFRAVVAHGYQDAGDVLGKGLVPTWGNYYGPRHLPPITIDHVLVDLRIGVRKLEAHQIPQSDHRSLIVTLTLPKIGGA